MSIVFTLGVFNLPRLTYHPKVNGSSFYGCNWKTFQAIVTILMSLDCQQRSFDVAYKSCPIFNSEVQLCQKHCSLALDCAMVLWNAQKTRFLCDFRSHPLAGDNNRNKCTYHATFIDLEPNSHWFSVGPNSPSGRAPSAQLTPWSGVSWTFGTIFGKPIVTAKDVRAEI